MQKNATGEECTGGQLRAVVCVSQGKGFGRQAWNCQLLDDASQRNTPSTLDIQGQMQRALDRTSGKVELPLPLLLGALPQLLKNSDFDHVNMGHSWPMPWPPCLSRCTPVFFVFGVDPTPQGAELGCPV